MSTWRDDKAWSDRFMPEIKSVLGQFLLSEAPEEDDAKFATDLIVLRMQSVRIAVRMRTKRWAVDPFLNEFTIRKERPSGARSELGKIVSGFGDFLFYGFECETTGRLGRWSIIDLSEFREQFMFLVFESDSKKFPVDIKYADNASFAVFPFDVFKRPVVAASGMGFEMERVCLT